MRRRYFYSRKYKKNKTYKSILIRESYRDENGKPQKRTIANISNWPKDVIEGLKKLLKGKKLIDINSDEAFVHKQGKSYGAIKTVFEISKRIGIVNALGRSDRAKSVLILIAGIIISSKKSKRFIANEWSKDQSIKEVFNYESLLDENKLYSALDYLAKKQSALEKKIWDFRTKQTNKKNTIFLYDITSSYVEGDNIAYSCYGYNRDKKRGKKQIVIGLLTDDKGIPMSVEVFEGNKRDFKTVKAQLDKLKKNFNVSNVVFVGDRGMIKSQQIEEINDENWNYITGITKPQIRKLIKDKVIQLEVFDHDLAEIKDGDIRYILRINPLRKTEQITSLESRISYLKDFVSEKNEYLAKHPRAKTSVALNKITSKSKKLNISKYVSFELSDRVLTIKENEEEIKGHNDLAGCYVLKTDVSRRRLTKDEVHEKYKDLYDIEENFKTLKTDFLNIRPVFVRKERHRYLSRKMSLNLIFSFI